MKKLHFVFMGKGGVGKTTVSSLMAQYCDENNIKTLKIDTDQVNASFAAFKALNVDKLQIMQDNNIDPRGWDVLVERLYKSKTSAIIDNGASSFIPLLGYALENELVELLTGDENTEVYFHIIIAGGEGLGHCLTGMTSIITQFKNTPAKYVIWLNPFLGSIEKEGKNFLEFPEFLEIEENIEAIISLPKYSSATFGEDMAYLLSNNLTFKEVEKGDVPGINIASRHRYSKIKKEIYNMLSAAQIFE